MNEESKSQRMMDDVQVAAVTVSASIIVFFVVYWVIQIQSVIDLLELAYG
jgi:hypothetical protein|tara:strand:+ start:62859 stop:63008 length:150 start_codon:yes stop_codon:yes gene_type:complete